MQISTLKCSVHPSVTLMVGFLAAFLPAHSCGWAADTGPTQFSKTVRPLLQQFCAECHSESLAEAELNLQAFDSLADVRMQLDVWVKVRRMLADREMPPQNASQPSKSQRRSLVDWVTELLKREALAAAGDPGPVLLRRLNNDEYNYTVRDLTGVSSLSPTREFPVDGAAGEGFINTGAAQTMSPAMAVKYLDSAKDVASHAVLLPNGIQFSPHVTRRDHTDEWLARIQAFYRRFTSDGGGSAVNLQGIQFNTNQGGRLPLRRYLEAIIDAREALQDGNVSFDELAAANHLSPKYLELLWNQLEGDLSTESMLLKAVQDAWKSLPNSPKTSLDELLAQVETLQTELWRFNSVGQLTTGGKQKIWMEPVTPSTGRLKFRKPLGAAPAASLRVRLQSSSLTQDPAFIVWERPRLEFPSVSGHPPLLLRDLLGLRVRLRVRVQRLMQAELPRTQRYLAAVSRSHLDGATLESIAKAAQLNVDLLRRWAKSTRLGKGGPRSIDGLLTAKIAKAHGYSTVNGWGAAETPSVLANASQQDVSFLTLTVPARGVVMHPSPTRESVAVWRSPIEGRVTVAGLVADADAKCGNGAAWRVESATAQGSVTLARGEFDNGGRQSFEVDGDVAVRRGDLISLIVNAKNRSHACDTTHAQLEIAAPAAKQLWDLSKDVVDRIAESNPLPDSYGHKAVWHFAATGDEENAKTALVAGSVLSTWREAVVANASSARQAKLAMDVQKTFAAHHQSKADQEQRRLLENWTGPLRWAQLASQDRRDVGDVSGFGRHPASQEANVRSQDLCLLAGQEYEMQLPSELAADAEFVVTARLHEETRSGVAQARLADADDPPLQQTLSLPVLVAGKGGQKLERACDDFRALFPPALCYARIVPVDEVVTMTLYFREDHQLRRLMLNEQQAAELDQLWDEMLFVAREPLALTVAYEQIVEFATQDRPDLVQQFTPMRKAILARAKQFRRRLEETAPVHLEAVCDFADRAWRRPLTADERDELKDFYHQLRKSEVNHEAAIRLSLARVLASPNFLYRRERQPLGETAPVSNDELATRLSYFLWSSAPDSELRTVAEVGKLTGDAALRQQAQRMLRDVRVRRLAIQFACQWLHFRRFDQNDDKNERMYPEFSQLRADMYEETVRFFEEMFRENRSILEVLDADYAYLNGALASHYQLADMEGDGWRRVGGMRAHGRGGVLGMATFLASQSGASRTSPILRGNWVYETLLGERLPRPPADVPQLPESVPDGLTARQLIEMHSSAPACATCHAKIDPLGFALEQFDAIGRRRSSTADTRTVLEDGTQLNGLAGLRGYLLNQRRDDFVRQFCRKLLGFAIGREVLLSDEPLLDTMQARLASNGYRFHVAVETIIESKQFRSVRGASHAALSR